ncbi:hypothetical protein ABPG74_008864 [Tetrahymena malaccensis]
MASQISEQSRASQRTQQILEEVAKQSQSKIYRLTGTSILDDEQVRVAWNAFGLYISRNLRMGRGVSIPNLGTFTLSAPEISLEGVTNKTLREKQGRQPVFIVSKEFCNGKDIKSGIYQSGQLRQYQVHGVNGSIPQTKINFTEVSTYCDQNKEETKACVERVIKNVQDSVRNKGGIEIEIPNVGNLKIRNNIAAVIFSEILYRDTKDIASKTLAERKSKGDMSLTRERVRAFQQQQLFAETDRNNYRNAPLQLDQGAKDYLKSFMNLDVDQLYQSETNSSFRPLTAKESVLRENYVPVNTWRSRPKTGMFKKNQTSITQNSSGIEVITAWVRSRNLNSEDSFVEFCKFCVGTSSKKSKLTEDNIIRGILNMDIDMNSDQVNSLFKSLDYNKDGFVDYNDWCKTVKNEFNNPHLQRIKDIIKRQNLKLDDILKTMQLDRAYQQLDLQSLTTALKRLDSSLNDVKARSVAQSILNEKEYITVDYLMEIFGCDVDQYLEEAEIFQDPNWYSDMLLRIKKKLESVDGLNKIKESFMKADVHNTGKVNSSIFKTVILDFGLGLNIQELSRLMRYVEKEQDGFVDYSKFLKSVKRIDRRPEGDNAFIDLIDFGEKLTKFLKRNYIRTAEELLKCIAQFHQKTASGFYQFTVEMLAQFLLKNAFQGASLNEILIYSKIMDIDQDSYISKEDLQTFLERINYLESDNKSSFSQRSKPNSAWGDQQNNASNGMKKKGLFPTKKLNNQQLEQVLIELRQILLMKKMQSREFFNILDTNGDGFITITEFNSNLDKIIRLSAEMKDGLFATMDSQKIGMIDFKNFEKVLEMSIIELQQKKDENTEPNLDKENSDNDWTWTKQTIDQMKDWFKTEKLTLEDAFRVFDKDFDGVISKNDLRSFLEDVLKCPKEDLTNARLNRVFKLMDEHKRGQIQMSDLKKIISGNYLQKYNYNIAQGFKTQTVWGGATQKTKSVLSSQQEQDESEEWLNHAKKQIGLTISRKFNSVIESFELISQHQKRMVFKQFSQWVDQSRALVGFDLTENQTQKVFSSLDPHKKGYLTQNDWINQFKNFSWKDQMQVEVREALQQNFDSKNSAFSFFLKDKSDKVITFGSFEQGIRSLFDHRFTQSDIHQLWFKISDKKDHIIDRNRFYNYLFDPEFPEKSQGNASDGQGTFRRPLTAPAGGGTNKLKKKIGEKEAEEKAQSEIDEEARLVVEKVKQLMRASNKSIEELCAKVDVEDTGRLSIIEFKNIFRNMNLNLTAKEIDRIVSYCDESNNGQIDWKNFLEKFKIKESVSRIIDRSKQRLQRMNEDIHYYMISPIDAFRIFNEERNGKLTFNQFTELVKKLCQMSKQELPSFAIIKDLFQIIDTRKDGVIDQQEWVQTFAKFKAPDSSLQGKPLILSQSNTQYEEPKLLKPLYLSQQKAINSDTLDSEIKEYDQLITIIGKNRKFLLDQFKAINQREPVTYEKALQVIHKMFVSLGKNLDHSCYQKLLKFAERDGIIDYKFLLDVYKERVSKINVQPVAKI